MRKIRNRGVHCYRIIMLFCLLISIQSNTIYAQYDELVFSNLTVEDGLSKTDVHDIFQDSRGFIWIGTEDGLNLYDGYSFKVFKPDDYDEHAISFNRVSDILEDSAGNIWVSTFKGLNKYDPRTEKFTTYSHDPADSNSLSHGYIYAMDMDENNNLWIATQNGLNYFNTQTGITKRFYHNKDDQRSLAGNVVTSVHVASDQNVWIGTQASGLSVYNPTVKNFMAVSKYTQRQFKDRQIHVIQESPSGQMWIGTFDGLFRMSKKINIINTYRHDPDNPNSIANNWIYGITFDQDGTMWIATDNGLNRFNISEQHFTHYYQSNDNPYSLPSNILRCVFIDTRNRLWVGSKWGGVSIHDPSKFVFTHYQNQKDNPSSLPHNNVQGFADAGNGDFWVVTDGGGLSFFDRDTKQFTHYQYEQGCTNCPNSNKMLTVLRDGKFIWTGSWDGGVVRFNTETGDFKTYTNDPDDPSTLSSNHIFEIYKDSKNRLWVGTWDKGLNLYNPEDESFERLYHQEENLIYQVVDIQEDTEGNLWIGTEARGLYKLHPNTKLAKHYTMNEADTTSINSNELLNIYFDSNNQLWIGTRKGLNLYKGSDEFKAITERDGLPNNFVYGIVEDSTGYLWLSTSKGVSRFDPDLMEFSNFTTSDGLQGNQFNRWSYSKLSTGEILFGGINGFNIFDPSTLQVNTLPPKVYITGLSIGNELIKPGKDGVLKESIAYTEELKLKHNQNFLSFDYVGINYTRSYKNEYEYMLEGLDNDWKKAGNNRKAIYTNLDPGNYVFKVKASNNDGYWSNETASVAIKITPPWYETWAFYIALFLFVSGSIFLFIRYREKQAARDRIALQQKIKEGEKQIAQKMEEMEKQQEDIRLRDLRDKEMRFLSEGLAKFSNIISSSKNDLSALGQKVISELVQYVDANMGAIYFTNDNENEQRLELYGSYGCDREKIEKKSFEVGESYIGTCFKDGEVIRVDNLPDDYTHIDSGLGDRKPDFLLLVPVKQDDLKVGVIEIAGFEELEDYKVDFIQKMSESVASYVTITKSNLIAQQMVERSNTQAEELKAQEEELRQNLEEMQSTQEELQRRVNENEQMQEDLKKEKALLDTILDNLPDLIYFKDKESKFIRLSKSMLTQFPVDNTDLLIGKSDFDFFDKDAAQKKYDEEQRIINSQEGVIDLLEHNVLDNGYEKWVSTTKLPLYDKDGNVIGTFGITKDITEIKHAEIEAQQKSEELQAQEEELRQNLEEMKTTQEELERHAKENEKMQEDLKKEQALLEAILDNLPDLVYFKDKESKFIRLSKSMLTQFPVDDTNLLIGKSDFDFFDKDDAQKKFEEEQKIIKTKKGVIDLLEHDVLDHGYEKWVSTTKLPLLDINGNVIGTFGISKDVTEMKNAELDAKQKTEELQAQEEELRQNLEEMQSIQEEMQKRVKENEKMQEDLRKEKSLLDAILDNLPDHIYFKDKESRFMRLSKSMINLFQVEKMDDLIGKSDFDFHDKKAAQKKYEEEQKIIKTKKGVIDLLEHDVMDNGYEKWVSSTKLPLYDIDGKVIGTFGITKDITEMKTAEIDAKQKSEELQAQEEELRQNLEEMQSIQDEMNRKQKEWEKSNENYEKEIKQLNQKIKDLNAKLQKYEGGKK